MRYVVFFICSFLCFLLTTGQSHSTEEYAEQTGQDCSICHVDPSGGAELTGTGQGYLLSLTGATPGDTTPAPKKTIGTGKLFKLFIGFIHLFTGVFWFGTILYVHLVLKPAYASKGLPPSEVRVGLISIAVMAVTGAILTYYRVPSWDFLLTTRFGILLLVKIALFLFLMISALIVVLFIGPRLRRKQQPAVAAIGDMSAVQLSRFDGKDGRKALIGLDGMI